jgi:hypothetical protein
MLINALELLAKDNFFYTEQKLSLPLFVSNMEEPPGPLVSLSLCLLRALCDRK